MAELSTLEELFLDEIQDLYDAEKQVTRALPKLAKAANSDELRKAFVDHLAQTRGHGERVEQVFEWLGEEARGKSAKPGPASQRRRRYCFEHRRDGRSRRRGDRRRAESGTR